mmetsp:Transcript_23554/g.57705  ORF Transcript_23554/g.57705 Transcript_23554/m.57705 type:complete len:215 (+) Transcript_23554:807-1451(+)
MSARCPASSLTLVLACRARRYTPSNATTCSVHGPVISAWRSKLPTAAIMRRVTAPPVGTVMVGRNCPLMKYMPTRVSTAAALAMTMLEAMVEPVSAASSSREYARKGENPAPLPDIVVTCAEVHSPRCVMGSHVQPLQHPCVTYPLVSTSWLVTRLVTTSTCSVAPLRDAGMFWKDSGRTMIAPTRPPITCSALVLWLWSWYQKVPGAWFTGTL